MPANYDATARSLALPISPPRSPKSSNKPTWTRRQSNQPHARNQSSSERPGLNFRDRIIDNAERANRHALRIVKKLTPLQKVLAGVAITAALVLIILFFTFNGKVFAWLRPFAVRWKSLRGGWLILWAMTFITAFPPVIGYSTCVTIAGFVYGFPIGWFVVASATVVGSLCSFIVSRTLLSDFVYRLVANDSRFVALSSVLKHDGLKLLIMIRLCPLPYSLSNGAMSTVPTVKPLTFALATAIATPKLMIHVFVGTRLTAIADSGEKMDATTKAINWASIVGGMTLGALTGWLIYRRTIARSRQIEAEERNNGRQNRSQAEEFADNPEEQDGAAASLEDDQIDFLGYGEGTDGYQDDDDDVFRFGDEDEEGAIGLDRQSSQR